MPGEQQILTAELSGNTNVKWTLKTADKKSAESSEVPRTGRAAGERVATAKAATNDIFTNHGSF